MCVCVCTCVNDGNKKAAKIRKIGLKNKNHAVINQTAHSPQLLCEILKPFVSILKEENTVLYVQVCDADNKFEAFFPLL